MAEEIDQLSVDSSLGQKLTALQALKEQVQTLSEKYEKDQAAVIEALRKAGHERFELDTPFTSIKGTVVAAERVYYDAEGLEGDLDEETWEKVTKRVLDTEKLEALVVAGIIPIETVDMHSEVKVNKPHIRFTVKKKSAVKKPKAKRQRTRATVL